MNSRWRFNKYLEKQKFAPHFDAGFTKNINESTHLTFILYLNEGFNGGETIFFPEGTNDSSQIVKNSGKLFGWSKPNEVKEVKVIPKIGLVLVFFHNGALSPRHEGAPHHSPDMSKYIIRSDIVFQRANPVQ